MNRVKKKLFAVALVAALLTFINPNTLAFYSTVGQATNVVTSGNLQFIIHEKTDQGKEFPQEGICVVPGDVVSKQVSIENNCQHPFYLRVKLVSGADSVDLSAEDCLKMDINAEHWQLHDGWYYYKGIVKPGETTPNAFSHVEIVGDKVDTRHIGKTLTLTVNAQAVQSENNPINDGKTYTASGWPAE